MDPHTRFQALTWLIAFIGGFGMLVIVVLAAMWRRHLKRDQRLERERAERQESVVVHIDTWQTAGERLQPINAPEGVEAVDDTDPDEADDDENRDDTWDRDPDEDEDDKREEPPWS